jgi:hypothetical protein
VSFAATTFISLHQGFMNDSRNLTGRGLKKRMVSFIVSLAALELVPIGECLKSAGFLRPLAAKRWCRRNIGKGRGMTVHRLFKNQAFEPEALSAMTRTYAEVCRALGLNDGDLAVKSGTKTVDKTRVAKTVIEFAQRGARDQRQLRDCVLQALKQ